MFYKFVIYVFIWSVIFYVDVERNEMNEEFIFGVCDEVRGIVELRFGIVC